MERWLLVLGKDMATCQLAVCFDDIDEEIVAESDPNGFGVAFEELSKGKYVASPSEVLSQARSHRKRSCNKDERCIKLPTQMREVALAIKNLSVDRLDVNDPMMKL